MQYEVVSHISKNTAEGYLPGTVIDAADFQPEQIAAYLAAGAIVESQRTPTPEPITKTPTATPLGVLGGAATEATPES